MEIALPYRVGETVCENYVCIAVADRNGQADVCRFFFAERAWKFLFHCNSHATWKFTPPQIILPVDFL